MVRRIITSVAVLVVLIGITSPALAQSTPTEAARAIDQQGYFIEPGTDVDEGLVSDVVSDAFNAGSDFGLVVLDTEPSFGASGFADRVLDARGGTGTVVVIAPETIGEAGNDDVFLQADLEAALDLALERGGSNDDYVRNIGLALTGAQVATGTTVAGGGSSSDGGGGGGGGGFVLLLVVVGGMVLVGWLVMRNSSKKRKQSAAYQLTEAKGEIKTQLDSVANDLLDLADRVRLADNDTADQYFSDAGDTYTEAIDAYESATDLQALESMSTKLDDAAWQLDAAEAVLEGREVPPRPKKEEPARCFFDPTHRPPLEDAVLKTSAGERTVKVCRADAGRLRQGEVPSSRTISVGGRQVPASRAPRSHGGLGMSGMDILSVIVGGLGQAIPMGGSRRGGGGLFGASRRSTPSRRSSSGGGIFGGGARPSGGSTRKTRSGSSSSRGASKPRSSSRSTRHRSGRRRR